MKFNKKKKETKIIDTGQTLYDINKDLVQKNEKELTATELQIKTQEIETFINSQLYCYYMLLCHERRDYTIFEYDKGIKDMNSTSNLVDILINECLKNRGEIRGINKIDGAIEIWLSINNEAFCYYLFPYDDAIILV